MDYCCRQLCLASRGSMSSLNVLIAVRDKSMKINASAPPRPSDAAYAKFAFRARSTSQALTRGRKEAKQRQRTAMATSSRGVRRNREIGTCDTSVAAASQMSWPVGYGRNTVTIPKARVAPRLGARGSAQTKCGRQRWGRTCNAVLSGTPVGGLCTEKRYHHNPKLGGFKKAHEPAMAREAKRNAEQLSSHEAPKRMARTHRPVGRAVAESPEHLSKVATAS
eukprot:scaffold139984_cov32-Tisochrysis_lutea.AAC.1